MPLPEGFKQSINLKEERRELLNYFGPSACLSSIHFSVRICPALQWNIHQQLI